MLTLRDDNFEITVKTSINVKELLQILMEHVDFQEINVQRIESPLSSNSNSSVEYNDVDDDDKVIEEYYRLLGLSSSTKGESKEWILRAFDYVILHPEDTYSSETNIPNPKSKTSNMNIVVLSYLKKLFELGILVRVARGKYKLHPTIKLLLNEDNQ